MVHYCEKLMGVVVFAKVQGQVNWFLALETTVLVHYCEELMGVVVFAKVQGQVKFESPRTRRVRGLSYFASPRTFVKTTTPINSSQ